MKSNQPLPDPIANAPEIPLGLGFFYKIFQELCSERTDGYIPGSAIRSYCQDERINGELKDDVTYHVKNLDHALLEFRRKKAEKERGGGKVG